MVRDSLHNGSWLPPHDSLHNGSWLTTHEPLQRLAPLCSKESRFHRSCHVCVWVMSEMKEWLTSHVEARKNHSRTFTSIHHFIPDMTHTRTWCSEEWVMSWMTDSLTNHYEPPSFHTWHYSHTCVMLERMSNIKNERIAHEPSRASIISYLPLLAHVRNAEKNQ